MAPSYSNAQLSDLLAYMLEDMKEEEFQKIVSDEDCIMVAMHLRSPFEAGAPMFGQVPTAELPAFIDQFLAYVSSQVTHTMLHTMLRAIGMRIAMGLNMTPTLIPTILERNHGLCVAAIQQHVDLSSPKLERISEVSTNIDIWPGMVGKELTLDRIQAAGQDWMACPDAFYTLHNRQLASCTYLLGRLKEEDLPTGRHTDNIWQKQLKQIMPDLGAFLSGLMHTQIPSPATALRIGVAMAVLQRMEAPMPQTSALVANAWARVFPAEDASKKTFPPNLLMIESIEVFKRWALQQIAQSNDSASVGPSAKPRF